MGWWEEGKGREEVGNRCIGSDTGGLRAISKTLNEMQVLRRVGWEANINVCVCVCVCVCCGCSLVVSQVCCLPHVLVVQAGASSGEMRCV